MVRVFLFFLTCSFLFSSCYCECCACEGAAGEVDLTVLDMDNKPISGVTVGPYVYPFGNNTYNFFKQTYQTDAKGQVHINYVFPTDSYANWTLAVADGTDLKAVNYVKSPYNYTPEHKKVTLIDTIRMDVLKPIMVRFKSNKTGFKSIGLHIFWEDYAVETKIKRNFYWQSLKIASMPLDTIVQVPAYAKAELNIAGSLEFANSALDLHRIKKLANYARRDTVFTFEF